MSLSLSLLLLPFVRGQQWSLLQRDYSFVGLAVEAQDIAGVSETQVNMHKASNFVQGLVEKTIVQDYNITDTEVGALETIRVFIGRVLEDGLSEHTEDQAEIDNGAGSIKGCSDSANSTMEGRVKSKSIIANRERQAHVVCRMQQGNHSYDRGTKCTAYEDYRKNTSIGAPSKPPNCMQYHLTEEFITTVEPDAKDDMQFCLVQTYNWASALYSKYIACKTSTDVHVNHTASCKAVQLRFEESFCAYDEQLDSVCDTQVACRNTSISSYNRMNKLREVNEAARKADYEVGTHILCFFKVFNTTSKTEKKTEFDSCANLSVNVSNLTLKYPSIHEPLTCVKELDQPCESTWTTREYTNQSWYASAQADPCTPCIDPTTTTTTLTTTTTTTTTIPTATTTTTTTTTPGTPNLCSVIGGVGKGRWTKIYQIEVTEESDSFQMTTDAVGDVTELGVSHSAKMSDADINALAEQRDAFTHIYAMRSSKNERINFVRTNEEYDDMAFSFGVGPNAEMCLAETYAECTSTKWFKVHATHGISWYHAPGGGSKQTCERWFLGGYVPDCWDGAVRHRCVSGGSSCIGIRNGKSEQDHGRLPDFEMFLHVGGLCL